MEVVKRIPNMRPKYLLEQKGEKNLRRERLQEFNLRISQASKTELIVIMYDIVLEDIECAKEAKGILQVPAPYVAFMELADNSLNFRLSFYISDVNNRLSTQTAVYTLIVERFREKNIPKNC